MKTFITCSEMTDGSRERNIIYYINYLLIYARYVPTIRLYRVFGTDSVMTE